MPELPEVETVRRGLAPAMESGTVTRLELRRPDLRFPFPEDFARRVEGQRVTSMGRRAKYLLADLEDGSVIIMHLGMSGSFRTEEEDGEAMPGEFHHARSRIEAHDHVIFHLTTSNGNATRVIYNDPRRFGFMLMTNRLELQDHPMFRDMGVEPVGNALDAEELARKFVGKKAPLKAALLDQRVIAGLGNIYVCEALWRSNLSQKREARTLVTKSGKPTERLDRLTTNIRETIAEAIEAGGSSLRDHAATDGTLGYFQHSFAAYDREDEPCRHEGCGKPIKRMFCINRGAVFIP